jgi:uncharacterized SAM-binding protein YcdF (DUF218 family)
MMTARCLSRVLLPPAVVAVAALALWLSGLVWFAGTIPRRDGGSLRPTDAIVVLTGGSERLNTGIQLLSGGLGRKLFVSGVHQGVELPDLLRTAQVEPGALECCIVLGHAAGNTVGNAAETAAWMQAEQFRSLRLVTGNYHIRRSLLEFRMALPDVEIVPHPVAPDHVRLDHWWRWPGTANLIVTEYNKYLVTLVRYQASFGFWRTSPRAVQADEP